MDSKLIERLESIKKGVQDFKIPGTLQRPPLEARTIINKYKYKTKTHRSRKNALLPEKFQNVGKLYECVYNVPTSRLGAQDFHSSLKSLVQNSRRLAAVENSANLAVIAAAGWSAIPLQDIEDGRFLKLKCPYCCSVIHLKVEDYLSTVEFENKAASLLAQAHKVGCLKYSKGYDLKRNYYLNQGNLCLDFRRISDELCKTVSLVVEEKVHCDAEKLGRLKPIFESEHCHFSLEKLSLALRGYTLVNSSIAECTGCYHRAFVKTFEDVNFQGHAKWCRYRDESKLVQMMLSQMDEKPKTLDMDQRLCDLAEALTRPSNHIKIE
ncbi:LAFA_0D03334g1_1 [Lachancea sp. 'fantastica']|nr:LAFA_0D03334g1_1 [Lachancea sp. 'fantastica']